MVDLERILEEASLPKSKYERMKVVNKSVKDFLANKFNAEHAFFKGSFKDGLIVNDVMPDIDNILVVPPSVDHNDVRTFLFDDIELLPEEVKMITTKRYCTTLKCNYGYSQFELDICIVKEYDDDNFKVSEFNRKDNGGSLVAAKKDPSRQFNYDLFGHTNVTNLDNFDEIMLSGSSWRVNEYISDSASSISEDTDAQDWAISARKKTARLIKWSTKKTGHKMPSFLLKGYLFTGSRMQGVSTNLHTDFNNVREYLIIKPIDSDYTFINKYRGKMDVDTISSVRNYLNKLALLSEDNYSSLWPA